MGDLAVDTAVQETQPGCYTATLSPEWEIWGPNGGYLAAVALRAAGAASGRARPASITAHFVGTGSSGPVEITTSVNRSTRVATSITVTISQDDRPWLVAIAWGTDADLEGLDHHTRIVPDVAGPEGLPSTEQLLQGDDGMPHPFWQNLEQRPLNWIADWAARTAAEPSVAAWDRFVPTSTFSDPWVDAARSLILVDLDSWPSATRAHVGELNHFAPTIEVTARFIGDTRQEPWLLSEASTPRAADGLLASTAHVWNTRRELVAVGGSTLLCRPAARRPDR